MGTHAQSGFASNYSAPASQLGSSANGVRTNAERRYVFAIVSACQRSRRAASGNGEVRFVAESP